jgi:hypothetical protein
VFRCLKLAVGAGSAEQVRTVTTRVVAVIDTSLAAMLGMVYIFATSRCFKVACSHERRYVTMGRPAVYFDFFWRADFLR